MRINGRTLLQTRNATRNSVFMLIDLALTSRARARYGAEVLSLRNYNDIVHGSMYIRM
jgi:hypothetical protein